MNEIEMLACGFGLVEGPRVDRDDSLYFSDVHKGGVHRRRADGTIETVVPKRRGVVAQPKGRAYMDAPSCRLVASSRRPM